jgi:hypothetical protein
MLVRGGHGKRKTLLRRVRELGAGTKKCPLVLHAPEARTKRSSLGKLCKSLIEKNAFV